MFIEAEAPRVTCPTHGVIVAAVPWARHGAGHTNAFDATVAWLATKCSKTAITELMRVAWRTVGSILTRVWGEVEAATDRLASVRRIGIDEISYKRGHKYLTVVVDHDSGHLLWAAPGRDAKTLRQFFDLLGTERSHQITHVSADGAPWIAKVIAERCRDAILCADPPPSLASHRVGGTPTTSCGGPLKLWKRSVERLGTMPAARPDENRNAHGADHVGMLRHARPANEPRP